MALNWIILRIAEFEYSAKVRLDMDKLLEEGEKEILFILKDIRDRLAQFPTFNRLLSLCFNSFQLASLCLVSFWLPAL